MIGAWERGVEQGDRQGFERGRQSEKNARMRAGRLLLDANLKKAFEVSEQMYAGLAGLGFHCEKVLLRVEDLDQFGTVFLVAESDFVNENFSKAYELGMDIENKVNADDFDFDFMFVPFTENTDLRSLDADGFKFRYPEVAPEATRSEAEVVE